jgi:hypothetical protein
MNTSYQMDNGGSRSFTRRASLVATFVAALTLASMQPVFAQSHGNSASEISTDNWGSEGDTTPPFEESWDDTTPAFAGGPALAPAPQEPAAPQASPMFGGLDSAPSAGPWMVPPESPLAQPWVNPSISATNPMPELPTVGPSPDGFARPIR